MKRLGSAIFPLSILLVLAALTFWLSHAVQLPETGRNGKNRHDPDYIINDSQLRKLDKTGRLQYTLKAVEIRHYPDDDTTDMIKPDLVHLHPQKAPVTMVAERGHLSRDGKQADLYDNVQVRRAASGTQEEMLAVTDRLTILPDDEKAFTKSPVLITQGKSWLKGVGLQIDNSKQTYVLESRAVGQFESQHAKKR